MESLPPPSVPPRYIPSRPPVPIAVAIATPEMRSLRSAPFVVRFAFGLACVNFAVWSALGLSLLCGLIIGEADVSAFLAPLVCLLPLPLEWFLLQGHRRGDIAAWHTQKGLSITLVILSGLCFVFVVNPYLWFPLLFTTPAFFLHLTIVRAWDKEETSNWYKQAPPR